jgi:hypothetical protein
MAGLFATQQGAPVVPESAYSQSFASTLPNTYFTIQATGSTFTSPGDAGPTTVTFGQKAIQELFDADYGRMNATLGAEIPVTNFLTQTTIPYANFDPPIDFIENNKAQIWKITHNGVDTHTIHFHLLNVQIVNRVGWDGAIRPPDANELGWKESVRMHPLEDIYVALKPVRQHLPWPMPDMIRPLDVIAPLGTASQFTGVDINNNPVAVTNQLQNYGWEYVWHCHLLGHEENDMLRAEVFVVAPETPTANSAVGAASGANAIQVAFSWTDNSLSALNFNVQRTDPLGNVSALGSVAAPTTTFTDTTALPNTAYTYQVQASKTLTSVAIPGTATPPSYTASSAWSNPVAFTPAPVGAVAPASLTFGTTLIGNTSGAQTVTLSNTGTATLTLASATPTADFVSASNTCGAGVGPGTSCTISVAFAPAAGPNGARTGTLTVVTNGGTFTVALTGTALNSLLQVAPTALAFTSTVGVRTAAKTVTVTNTSAARVFGLAWNVSGNQFAVSNGTTTCGTSIAAGASCTIGVTFRPTTVGNKTSTLTVSWTGAGSPKAVALTGTVLAPVLAVSPASLTFPDTNRGTASAPLPVTVSNTGTAPLIINSISDNSNQYTFASTCPIGGAGLAAGGSCTVSVTFRPSGAAGIKNGTLTVSVAAPATSATVALSGRGL